MLEDDSTLYLERPLTEKFKKESKTNENGIILPSQRILTNINPISTGKYKESKCLIYLLSEKKKLLKINKNKRQHKKIFVQYFKKK